MLLAYSAKNIHWYPVHPVEGAVVPALPLSVQPAAETARTFEQKMWRIFLRVKKKVVTTLLTLVVVLFPVALPPLVLDLLELGAPAVAVALNLGIETHRFPLKNKTE